MECLEKSFSEIEIIDKNRITFIDGEVIVFKECIKQHYNSETCVAERDILAKHPYFKFFTPDIPTKIIFDQTGLFSNLKNLNNFRNLQKMIIDFGYSSYDLS
ncbi:MAG: hypothetical protein E7478_06400 [Ruminococcaceae bacterium]|nr:hypothetical protein [Oscillospiraceae bacterium]